MTNPDNYLLIQAGSNTLYDTASCLDFSNNGGAVLGDDVQIPTGPIIYDPATFTATVALNGGAPLPYGEYRLLTCGTTSITDLAGNSLNGGVDSVINFALQNISRLPSTGFAPGRTTLLPEQTPQTIYASLGDLWLEIPSLGVQQNIVGVPQTNTGWDVSWLGRNIGYLNGTAFPTWAGNTVLTGHVYDAYGQPGPFAQLKTLNYGDKIEIKAFGQTYTYEVRERNLILPNRVSSVLQHEEYDWVTLVTCEFYNPFTEDYLFRRAVRAVLVDVR